MTLNNCTNLNEVQYMISGVDGLVVAAIPIFTTLASAGNFYVTNMLVTLESVTGVATGGMGYTLGFNGPVYDNIMNGDNTNAVTAGEYQATPIGGSTVFSAPPSTTVFFNLVTAETTATTYIVKVVVQGNYI